ncbi:hypothetical protein TRFO_21815 [Tritrichomonas foetus]|uniref:Importin N-terminal domain-containing protein n=1 Tax=Tritrichomonas foetus TaxID=1144522 RepID=A0A1J4KE88_9EUKA|nr:hypothetical protein TRFO_21815 [Tritrichomonas foetus]|eukprot:OHT09322.1 hypothetical protein TRFO_21815 [Tritrichomonas foetus]
MHIPMTFDVKLMTEVIDFSSILEQCISNKDSDRQRAANILDQFRSENIFNFLQMLLDVLMTDNTSNLSKNVSLVLSWKTIDLVKSPDITLTEFEFFENSCPSLINSFLEAAFHLLNNFPIFAGHLYSTLAIVVYEYNENSNLIQTLCEKLNDTNDLNLVTGVLTALEDICNELILAPHQYYPILQKILFFINFSFFESVKILSLNILKRLICIIDDFLKSPENSQSLLHLLTLCVDNIPLKSVTYRCLGQLIKYQFNIFLPITEKIIEQVANDLNAYSANEDIIHSILYMLQQLTITDICDKFFPYKIEILKKSFEIYFPIFIQLLFHYYQPCLDSHETYNTFKIIIEVIARIVELLPKEISPYLFNFFLHNISAQQPVNKEISCVLISLVITFFNPPLNDQVNNSEQSENNLNNNHELFQILQNLTQLLPELLTSSYARVRESAVFIIMSILNQKELLQYSIHSLLQMMPILINLLNDDPIIASHVCSVFEEMIPFFPILDLDFPTFLSILLNYVNSTDIYFLTALFNCIIKIIEYSNENNLRLILPALMNIVKISIQNPYSPNFSEVLFMFANICQFARDLLNPYVNEFFPLFTNCYNITKNKVIIRTLTYFIKFTHNKVYFPDFINILFNQSNDEDFILNMEKYFLGPFVEISRNFDIRPFISDIFNILLPAMSLLLKNHQNQANIHNKLNYTYFNKISNIVHFISIFIHDYYENSISFIEPTIQILSEPILFIQKVYDDDIRLKFIEKVSSLFKNVIEKTNQDDSRKLLPIIFTFLNNCALSIDVEETGDLQLEYIILLICQVINIGKTEFQRFLSTNDQIKSFINELLKNENLHVAALNIIHQLNVD